MCSFCPAVMSPAWEPCTASDRSQLRRRDCTKHGCYWTASKALTAQRNKEMRSEQTGCTVTQDLQALFA